ncbi:hypothetical protein CJF15_12515 [Clostridium botulinum]|uniref:hypothetical protein n=1 Tax=Clostridium botulinum TaxID=1491 RepID=UPI001969BD21|nr:hypothetical protein [Clostridium botulinum]MBN3409926.1 hypothetical protein [Clostridium botulinum]MBY6797063.1 hypothetical protein [Clostridium botulinum]MBY6866514.1 hypothetical protein [Clostridium botulinum]MBY6873013.1 hypothetical protein [Clostridium botulinum]
MKSNIWLHMFLLIYISTSIGVYIKLRRYGTPRSAIMYAGFVPIVALLINLISSIDFIKKHKKANKKIRIFILLQLYGIKDLSILTGLVCIKLGKNKIGIKDLVRAFTGSLGCIKKLISLFEAELYICQDKKLRVLNYQYK